MNSFGKDLLGFVFLVSWVLPTLALVLHLVFTRLVALWRGVNARVPVARKARVRALSERRPARIAPLSTPASATACADRPRLGDRWKSSQRLTTGTC
jgi:hypothetical protein